MVMAVQTADMLNLPVPEAHYETVIVEPSELQKEMVQELSERAAAVHNRKVDATVDNMLKITTDGRKIGLDQRLINPLLEDFPGSKVNACTENVFQIWNDTSADRLTQLVFCDFSTPNKDKFNVYNDIKAKLLERGIPESEIAFIHDADTELRKKELFAKVRQGKVRVLFGSTAKMGSGTNVQDRLVAIHDADCPWRPADLEQRAGRIVRQGNQNEEVKIFRYATSGTFVSYWKGSFSTTNLREAANPLVASDCGVSGRGYRQGLCVYGGGFGGRFAAAVVPFGTSNSVNDRFFKLAERRILWKILTIALLAAT